MVHDQNFRNSILYLIKLWLSYYEGGFFRRGDALRQPENNVRIGAVIRQVVDISIS
jgi:hypothetical protein